MKWRGYEGLYHDNSHHLALPISRKDRTNRSVTHPNRPRLPRKRIFFFFSFFPFLFQSRATSSSPGGLGIPSRWHHELNAPVIERERKSFCVCRRERAIRSRQSFGHQPERRDVTYIYKSPSFPPLFYIANRLCLSIFAAFCTEKFFFFFFFKKKSNNNFHFFSFFPVYLSFFRLPSFLR